MAASVVGVDIGTATIRAVEVTETSKPRPQLARFHEVALPEGAVSRGEILEPNTVAAAFRQLWAEGRFSSKNVALGMGNQRVLARDLAVPKASLQHIRESLPFAVQDMLPVPVSDALLDFYPMQEVQGESGPMVNGLLIAAVKEAVLGNVKAVELAGLRPLGVDLIPFALCRVLVGRDQPHTESTVVVDVGANTTSIVVTTGVSPQFVRIIPTGGAVLTDAISASLEIPPAAAEALKRRLGLATEAHSLDEQRAIEVIYRVTGELLNSLRNTINYYANTRPGEAISRIVLTGGASHLPGFAEAIGEMTRLPVVPGDPFTGVGLSRKLNADQLRERRSSLAVALGLALWRAA